MTGRSIPPQPPMTDDMAGRYLDVLRARETTPAAATFPDAGTALAYRQAHDTRVKALYRKAVPTLRDIEHAHLASQGIQRAYGGPVSKDELINAILATEYPAARLNEASHVLYHKPGESWSACEWCHPHQGATCECDLRGAS